MKAVWYVTRKYPPGAGGMQLLACQISSALRQFFGRPVVVSCSCSRLTLPVFLVWAALRILWGRLQGRISVLYLGDPLLAILARMVQGEGIPVVVTVHGLDILYPNPIYQAYLAHFFWDRCDKYIAISRHVATLLRDRGVPERRIEVVPPGIEVSVRDPRTATHISQEPTLLALGRLVERKGLTWFVESVAPRVFTACPRARLIIAGGGPERERIAHAVRRTRLENHIHLVGHVDDQAKANLLSICDAVIMPNVPIANDAEGFGIVALEAGSMAKPVFASDLDGLRDAVRDGENGWRLPARNANAWAEALIYALGNPEVLRRAGERAYECVQTSYAWRNIGRRYAEIIGDLARTRG